MQSSARIFPTVQRGTLREDALTSFRVGARQLINPRTNAPWTNAEIAATTAKGSPRYIDADALDLVLQLEQSRGLYLADQVRQDRASTKWLTDFHGPMWGLTYLPSAGGSGLVSAPCAPSTTYFGSTTLGAPTASVAADTAGNSYQVLFQVTSPSDGTPAALTLAALSGGEDTNLAAGAILTWSTNVPLGAAPTATVAAQFRGGVGAETDAQFVRRLQRRTRHKAGSGNRSELCAWAEAFSTSIDVTFAYSAILYAGTGLLVPVAKRASNVRGPLGRIPSVALLAGLTGYLVPPGSPVVPDFALLWTAPPVATPSDMAITLSMPLGNDAGWADFQPWPMLANGVPAAVGINILSNQTHFQVNNAGPLPIGVTQPKLMAWDAATSTFEQLNVTSVTFVSGTLFNVVLASAPSMTLALGTSISPWTELAPTIADTIELYFDGLGPGEVIDVSSTSVDPRRSRAYRFVVPNEEYPYRAGAGVTSYLQDALVGSFIDGLLYAVSVAVPPIPADPTTGPGLLVAGNLGVYPM